MKIRDVALEHVQATKGDGRTFQHKALFAPELENQPPIVNALPLKYAEIGKQIKGCCIGVNSAVGVRAP